MKKHELLEKAMRDYPAGTKFKRIEILTEVISSGVFQLSGNSVFDAINKGFVYTPNGDWATIIPAEKTSLLSGKCAIAVNNEREFKLLMEHMHSKGWSHGTFIPYSFHKHYCAYDYHDKFRRGDVHTQENEGYTIIPFADFADELNIPVPVFVMTSEDNVPIYVGDDYYCVHRSSTDNKWTLLSFRGDCTYKIDKDSVCLESERFFSTKEAATAFVDEQNKPKEVTVQLFNEFHSAKITKEWIDIRVGKEDSNTTTMFKPSDLEDMLHAYKSLQP